jgi:hypothetical protein
MRAPTVRKVLSWSVTVNTPPVIAALPEFLTTRLITPPEPAATEPPTVPPLGAWVEVMVIWPGIGITI